MSKRISEMNATTELTGTDIIPIVDGNGNNKTVTGDQVKNFASNGKQNSLLGGNIGFDTTVYDLNDFKTENKNYWISTANVLNTPVNNAYGFLEIIKYSTGSSTLQRFTRYSSNTSILGETYIRAYANNTWGSWVKIAAPIT